MGERPTHAPREAYSYRADPTVPAFPDERPIIVFDGECALCSGFVRFVLERDASKRFRLLPAQSALGAALYAHYGKKRGDYETHILIESGVATYKSDAAIRVLDFLGMPWSLARASRVLPLSWRDALYDLIARNRIRWFGARACYSPTREDTERFLA